MRPRAVGYMGSCGGYLQAPPYEPVSACGQGSMLPSMYAGSSAIYGMAAWQQAHGNHEAGPAAACKADPALCRCRWDVGEHTDLRSSSLSSRACIAVSGMGHHIVPTVMNALRSARVVFLKGSVSTHAPVLTERVGVRFRGWRKD